MCFLFDFAEIIRIFVNYYFLFEGFLKRRHRRPSRFLSCIAVLSPFCFCKKRTRVKHHCLPGAINKNHGATRFQASKKLLFSRTYHSLSRITVCAVKAYSISFGLPSKVHSLSHSLPQLHRLRLSERFKEEVLLFLLGLCTHFITLFCACQVLFDIFRRQYFTTDFQRFSFSAAAMRP